VARCFLEVHIGLAGCIRALRSMAFTSNTQKQTSHSQVHWELLQHTYYSYSDYKKYSYSDYKIFWTW